MTFHRLSDQMRTYRTLALAGFLLRLAGDGDLFVKQWPDVEAPSSLADVLLELSSGTGSGEMLEVFS